MREKKPSIPQGKGGKKVGREASQRIKKRQKYMKVFTKTFITSLQLRGRIKKKSRYARAYKRGGKKALQYPEEGEGGKKKKTLMRSWQTSSLKRHFYLKERSQKIALDGRERKDLVAAERTEEKIRLAGFKEERLLILG